MINTKSNKRKKIVARIRQHITHGATYREVRDFFNRMEFYTIGGSEWSIQSLHRFYKTHGNK